MSQGCQGEGLNADRLTSKQKRTSRPASGVRKKARRNMLGLLWGEEAYHQRSDFCCLFVQRNLLGNSKNTKDRRPPKKSWRLSSQRTSCVVLHFLEVYCIAIHHVTQRYSVAKFYKDTSHVERTGLQTGWKLHHSGCELFAACSDSFRSFIPWLTFCHPVKFAIFGVRWEERTLRWQCQMAVKQVTLFSWTCFLEASGRGIGEFGNLQTLDWFLRKAL